jgi:hypothetical protein
MAVNRLPVLEIPEWRLRVLLRRQPVAPLLEEERHAEFLALIAQRTRPLRVHRPRAGAALAADDHPPLRVPRVVLGEVRRKEIFRQRHGPQQRLAREEPHRGGDPQQVRDALVRRRLVLHAGPDPDVPVIREPDRRHLARVNAGGERSAEEGQDVFRPLGEQEPIEVRRLR